MIGVILSLIFLLVAIVLIYLRFNEDIEITQKFPALSTLTTKLPISKIVGIVVLIIVAVLLANFLISVNWQKVIDGGDDIYRPEKGLREWRSNGVEAKYGYFYFSSGGSLAKEIEIDGVNVRLFDIETEAPSLKSDFVVKIEDLDGHGRSATFRFLVEGDKITFSKLSLSCCGAIPMDLFEAAPVVNNEDIWNYAKASMRGRIASYAIGKDGRIETFSIPLDGSLQRSERINYKITILNNGPSPLKVGRIEIVSG